MLSLLDPYTQTLHEREQQHRLRKMRITEILPDGELLLDGRRLVNFASNDYLGLSQDQRLKARAIEYIQRFGVGNPSSRLICGNQEPYYLIERKIAQLKGTETALIMASGFQANSTVLAAIGPKGALIGSDRLNHNSILQGLLASQSTWFRYRHNDPQDLLQRFLHRQNHDHSPKWVITESVFSMDGDMACLSELKTCAVQNSAGLYVDEAHATGVLGKHGMGLTAQNGLADIAMGTFGKGLGSFGAYIACSNTIRQFLINCCPGLVYSTALPPPVLGAIDAALDLIPEMDKEREKLLSNADYLRSRLQTLGFDCAKSATQIIPIVIGNDRTALSLSESLEQQGFYVPAIRPPTVPEGSARLRISLSTKHNKEQISALIKALKNWHEKKD